MKECRGSKRDGLLVSFIAAYWFAFYVLLLLLNHFSPTQLFVTLWTIAFQAPLSMEILQARILEWVAMPSSRRSSQPKDQTQVSHIADGFYTV